MLLCYCTFVSFSAIALGLILIPISTGIAFGLNRTEEVSDRRIVKDENFINVTRELKNNPFYDKSYRNNLGDEVIYENEFDTLC